MHPVWRGSISFGLINIPVRLYHASKAKELKFKMLHKKDLSEIRYARICKADGKEVPWEEVVKGLEIEEGKYVIFTEEDFEKANLRKTKTFDILHFAEEKEIDTIYYDLPYYLEPEKGAAKAYQLLTDALKRTKKVGIGSFAFRNHEHLGLIKPLGSRLALLTLRFASDMTNPLEIKVPKGEAFSKKEMEIALQLIDELSEPFDPKNYFDTYTDEIQKLIRQKAKGKKIAKIREPESPKVQDILSLLKKSLEQKKKRKSA